MSSDSDLVSFRNKVHRDIAMSEKKSEDLVRILREDNSMQFSTIEFNSRENKNLMFGNIQELQNEQRKFCTQDTMEDYVFETKKEINKTIQSAIELAKDENLKQINVMYADMNSHEEVFGPMHDTKKSLKDYTVTSIKAMEEEIKHLVANNKNKGILLERSKGEIAAMKINVDE